MTFQLVLCLIIFIAVLISFAINKLPMAATAMIGMMALVLTGCLDADTVIRGFSSTTVLLLAPMFLIAAAFGKTQTVNRLSRLVVKFSKGSLRRVVAGYVLFVLVINEFIGSSSAVFFIAYPLVIACCREMQVSPSKVIFPVGLTCMATGGILPTTSAISMCEVWRGYFEAYEITEYSYSVLDYCLARFPLAIIIVLFSIFYAPQRLPERTSARSLSTTDSGVNGTDVPKLSTVQEYVTVAVFVLLILGVAFGGTLGIPNWQISMTGALILVAAGVMRGKEVYNSLGLSVIFLLIGSTAIASALQQTGAADLIGQILLRIFGGHPNGYFIGFVFFLIPCVLSQVLSNSAVNYIFVPICLMTCSAFGGNPVGPMFLTISGALTGYLTPMANPTAPVMFELGGYEIRDIIRIAPVLIIPATVVSVFWEMTIFPLY